MCCVEELCISQHVYERRVVLRIKVLYAAYVEVESVEGELHLVWGSLLQLS